MKRQVALLVMDYGTPRTEQDIATYYTNIRHGHPPTTAEVDHLTSRYKAIGGLSPLAKITEWQAHELARQLEAVHSDWVVTVFLGHKYISPTIEEAATAILEGAFDEVLAITMAPYASKDIEASYFNRLRSVLGGTGTLVREVPHWAGEEAFKAYWAEAIRLAHGRAMMDGMAKGYGEAVSHPRYKVVFTGHSVPQSIIDGGDRYAASIEETVHEVAALAHVKDYTLVWQSAGKHGQWLQPDITTVTTELSESYEALMYVPIGFSCSHLEVLYDIDQECRQVCDELKVAYSRVDMPDRSTLFIEAMASAIEKASGTTL